MTWVPNYLQFSGLHSVVRGSDDSIGKYSGPREELLVILRPHVPATAVMYLKHVSPNDIGNYFVSFRREHCMCL